MKKRIVFVFLVLLLIVTVAFITATVYGDTDKTVVKQYGIVYRTYKTEGNCSVKDPNGKTVSIGNNGRFVPTNTGEYIIEYADKTVVYTVRAYPLAPEYLLEYEFETEYSVGETLVLPILKIVNPENYSVVDKYNIRILCDGNAVYSTKSDNDEYTFQKAGKYEVVYNYENVYGINASKSYGFEVNNDPVIIFPQFAGKVRLGTSIDLSGIYCFFDGETVDVDIIVNAPGSVPISASGVFVFDEVGKYVITANAEINGEQVEKSIEIETFTDLGSLFTGTNIDRYEEDAPLQPYTNVSKGQKGVKIITGKTGSSVYYNTPIDLTTLDKNTNLIEFDVLSSDLADMSAITVRLTDVYDASNWIEIRWKDCTFGSVPAEKGTHSYVYLAFSNGFRGSIRNADPNTVFFGTTSSSCMVAYNNCFHGKNKLAGLWDIPLGVFQCQFNYSTKEIFTYDDKYVRQRRMGDIDDVSLMGNYAWKGFTTDEAYLSIIFDAVVGEQSGINVLQIAGKNLSNDSFVLGPTGDVRMDADIAYIQHGLPSGAVGYPYTIPEPVKENIVRGKFEAQTILEKMNGSVAEDISNKISDGIFTPEVVGEYRIVYKTKDAHGYISEKSYSFYVDEHPDPITISPRNNPQPSVLSWFVLPEYAYSGGRGKLTTEYVVKVDGEECEVLNNRIFIDKNCTINVDFIVKDYIGYKETVSRNYTVNNGKTLFVEGVPDAFIVGNKVFLENFKAYDFTYSANDSRYVLNKRIYIDGQLYDANAGYTATSGKTSVVLEYRGINKSDENDYVYEHYTVPVVTVANKNDMSGYFLPEAGVTVATEQNDVAFKFNGDGNVKFVNPVAADGLRLVFSVNSSVAGKIVILMEDFMSKETQVCIEIMPYNDTNSRFYVNGTFCGYVSGSFVGKSYEISYDNFRYAFSDAGGKIGEIVSTLKGDLFEGFSGLIRLSFGLADVTGNCSVELAAIGNQSFGSEPYSKGDMVGPQFVFSEEADDIGQFMIGDVFTTFVSVGADVLKGKTAVKLTVYTPSGETVYKNVDASKPYSVSFYHYGWYRFVYTSTDGTKPSQKEIRVYIVDKTPPEILVSETISENIKVGTEITIPGASMTDNLGLERQWIYIITPDGRIMTVSGGNSVYEGTMYKFETEGEYIVAYCAYDKDFNICRKMFVVKVSK